MIQSWFAYLIHQSAYAGTALVIVFLLAELLAPGSVLPFLNLHALVVGVLVLHGAILVIQSQISGSLASRMAVVVSTSLLLLAAVWLLLAGAGKSAMLLALAVSIIIVAFATAIIHSYAKH
jgi:hypothetical protein